MRVEKRVEGRVRHYTLILNGEDIRFLSPDEGGPVCGMNEDTMRFNLFACFAEDGKAFRAMPNLPLDGYFIYLSAGQARSHEEYAREIHGKSFPIEMDPIRGSKPINLGYVHLRVEGFGEAAA